MALTIAQVVGQFKGDVAKVLSGDMILQLCRDLNHVWRKRVLDPVTTVQFFLLQILHGNIACNGLRRLVDLSFTAAAYCEARSRLPLALFEKLLQRFAVALQTETKETGRWHGHRTWTLDGSTFSMPDTKELQEYFGQPSAQAKGCGFPVAHMLALFHADTGLLLRVVASPLRTHDMSQAATMHPTMDEGDILIADRGLASFTHLALLVGRKMHAVFRCHQKQIANFRPGRKHTSQGKPQKGLPRSRWLKRLGKRDQLVEYTKPKTKPCWMEKAEYEALPETLTLREIRYTIPQKSRRTRVITLVTTLLDPIRYPAEEIARLYEQRWQVEVNLRHLKTTMKMEVLHCHTVAGVHKELLMFALAYNLVRLVMLEASRRQRVPLERISFVDALRWLRTAELGVPLPNLMVNPARPNRREPRVLKRRMKSYDLMNQPREKLRQTLETKRITA
jgi:hypothetical protein